MSILNPTNFLELVQRYAIEAGITDDPPTTLVGANAQLVTLMNHINQANLTIEMLHEDWKFKRVSPGVSFATVADQMIYTPTQAGVALGIVTKWLLDTFRVYTTAVGTSSEVFMDWMDYDDWRDSYQIGALRTARVQPTVIAVAPNFSLAIPCPLAGYTITGDYIEAPIPFEDDTDIPKIPQRFIMVIVWKALLDYATDESAPEVYAKAMTNYNSLMLKMEVSQLPPLLTAGPLA